jgi:hypothetical protein
VAERSSHSLQHREEEGRLSVAAYASRAKHCLGQEAVVQRNSHQLGLFFDGRESLDVWSGHDLLPAASRGSTIRRFIVQGGDDIFVVQVCSG